MAKNSVFLLSPASTSGRRAQLLFNEHAEFELARALRTPQGATLGEVFSFLSGLYFRGKLAYARHFACSSPVIDPILVITSNRGLLPPDVRVTLDDLRDFARFDIDAANAQYRAPLEQSAAALEQRTRNCRVVLLGSIATGKYADVLLRFFGERLCFPQEFVGRGDMSRGGLLLRCVDSSAELSYVPLAGALRNGKRPPRLAPR